jgi:hypothetical protein
MMGNYGSGVLEFVMTDQIDYLNGYSTFDSTVFVIEPFLDGIYAGGQFKFSFNTELNGIGIMEDVITTIQQNNTALNIKAFPNPTDDYIFIEGISEQTEIKIFSIDGKLVEHYTANQNHRLKTQPSGLYLLQAFQKGKQETLKILFN